MPGAQGAWGNEVAPPVPEPVVETVHEPGPHETSGRDSGSVHLGGVRLPDPGQGQAPAPGFAAPHEQSAPTAPRRPLHLGPPVPDLSAGPVRSLADRGPAHVPVRQSGPPTLGPEYLDVPRAQETAAPQAAAPWGTQAAVGRGGGPRGNGCSSGGSGGCGPGGRRPRRHRGGRRTGAGLPRGAGAGPGGRPRRGHRARHGRRRRRRRRAGCRGRARRGDRRGRPRSRRRTGRSRCPAAEPPDGRTLSTPPHRSRRGAGAGSPWPQHAPGDRPAVAEQAGTPRRRAGAGPVPRRAAGRRARGPAPPPAPRPPGVRPRGRPGDPGRPGGPGRPAVPAEQPHQPMQSAEPVQPAADVLPEQAPPAPAETVGPEPVAVAMPPRRAGPRTGARSGTAGRPRPNRRKHPSRPRPTR
ncbi:hypothetical protein SBADM41S_02216 [Streptomyces badius]